MNQNYEPEFKKIVRLHLEKGRTLTGFAEEDGVSKASIFIWMKQFREDCRANGGVKADHDYKKEIKQFAVETVGSEKLCYIEQMWGYACSGDQSKDIQKTRILRLCIKFNKKS